MIVMFLCNPVAFVACLLCYVFVDGVYDWTGRGDPGTAVGLTVLLGSYLLAVWLLPWWCRPTGIWRWWRNR